MGTLRRIAIGSLLLMMMMTAIGGCLWRCAGFRSAATETIRVGKYCSECDENNCATKSTKHDSSSQYQMFASIRKEFLKAPSCTSRDVVLMSENR